MVMLDDEERKRLILERICGMTKEEEELKDMDESERKARAIAKLFGMSREALGKADLLDMPSEQLERLMFLGGLAGDEDTSSD